LAPAVPGAVAGVAAGRVDVDGVVAARDRVGDVRADLVQDGRGLRRVRRGGRGVDDVAEVADARADLAIGAPVFVGGLGVVRAAEARVPAVEAGDLVAGEAAVGPAGAPEDGFGDRRRHHGAAVRGHVGRAAAA